MFVAPAIAFFFLIGGAYALTTYRNVALNTNDSHNATALPHATSNSETYYDAADNWSTDFIASNAVNGARANTSHGSAYPSWGPWTKAVNPTPWLKITLDTAYEVDSAAFYIRADFNLSDSTLDHDTYWSSGNMVFSDSSKVPIKFVRKSAAQCFKFPKRETRSLMIRDLVWRSYVKNGVTVSDGWAGITELELYGQKKAGVDVRSVRERTMSQGVNSFIVFAATQKSFVLPANSRGFCAYTLPGRKIWSFSRSASGQPLRVTLPQSVGNQVVRIAVMK